MPAGGESLVAGSYTTTWNAIAIGISLGGDDCPSITQVKKEWPVDNTDKYGKTKIDAVYAGAAYTFQAILMEYSKALPLVDPDGIFGAALGVIGTLRFTLAKALVLTAVAGTTAATAPATLTSNKTIAAADFDAKLKFGPEVRLVPIKLDMYLYDVGAGALGFNVKT